MKLVLFSLLIFFWAMLVDAQPGDRRIDEEETYWKDQDIRKALDNNDKISWMIYRTLRGTERAKNKCVFAEVKEKETGKEVYRFVQRYKRGDGTEEEQTLYAIPYKTEPVINVREKENAMRVTRNKDTEDGRRYVLIYSDYICCDILRSLEDENGAACELYLHDHCVSKPVPRACESQYGNACGRGNEYKTKVYDPSCRNTTDVTPKPTPEGPQTPEETATPSTLPPGC